jgi:hypothetical protein
MNQILSNQMHLDDCTGAKKMLTVIRGGYLAIITRDSALLGHEVALNREQAICLRDWLTSRIDEGSIKN